MSLKSHKYGRFFLTTEVLLTVLIKKRTEASRATYMVNKID